jgi:CubicO group peptidase (beta-lactamase class C family)
MAGVLTRAPGRRITQSDNKLPNAGPTRDSLRSELDNFFGRAEAFGFSGSVIAAKGEDVILEKAYGLSDRRRGIPNTTSTVFSLASLDKQFIAAAVLRLEELGKLKTSDSIAKFFDFVPPEKSAVTLHTLLSNTSGLPNDYWDQHPQMDRPAFVRFVLHDRPLVAPPAESWLYSNSGFVVLEEVVERVSGKPFDVFLQEAIFDPAGLTHTGYPSRKWEGSRIASYLLWTVELPRNFADAKGLLGRPRPLWVLMSTVEDMYRWYLALRSNRVLTPESAKKLFTVVKEDYAYGWNVITTPRGTRLIEHGGSGSGVGMVATFRWFADEDAFLVVLSNSTNPTLAADYFMGDVESAIFGGTPSLPPAPDGKSAEAKKMVGSYALANGAVFEIKQAIDGRLAVVTQDKRAITLFRFPDTAGSDGSGPQDEIALEVLRGVMRGDYQPLRKVLRKEQPFEPFKAFLERNKPQKEAFGDLRRMNTVFQRWFFFGGQGEVHSFIRMEFEKGEVVIRVIHFPSGEITLNMVDPPPGLEAVLVPTIGGMYSTWDFTLGHGARITFAQTDTTPRLIVSGDHSSIVASKQ